jgi:superfamily II DNA or RNA helicase
MHELRPYQTAAIDEVRDHIRSGFKRILIVIATGGGKTFTASWMILAAILKGKRCVFLAHRKELIDQCCATLDSLSIDYGVIKSGDRRFDLSKPVQVASVQTLVRRPGIFPADLVFIDEAHRSSAPTYEKTIKEYEDSVIIGLTATPYRTDGSPLGKIYQKMVEVISIAELIESGCLVNPEARGAKKPIDIGSLSVSRGDFVSKDMDQAIEPKVLRGEILSNWASLCEEKLGSQVVWETDGEGGKTVVETDADACTVIFCPSVKKSKEVAEQFMSAGVIARHIDANTPDEEREGVLKGLERGDISVVCNVGLLNEGWDLPRLECIIALRPTTSKGLVMQMGGRIMRPDERKRMAVILDHACWFHMHGMLHFPTAHSLEEAEKRPNAKERKEKKVQQCPKCTVIRPKGSNICPACGFEWAQKEKQYIHTSEELVRLSEEDIVPADVIPRDERQRAFNRLAAQCAERGYKPNWAKMKYKSLYGKWPTGNNISIPGFFLSYERDFNNNTPGDRASMRGPLDGKVARDQPEFPFSHEGSAGGDHGRDG